MFVRKGGSKRVGQPPVRSLAAMVRKSLHARVRLLYKQPWPPVAKRGKSTRKRPTVRNNAVSEGMAPKARRPFALFLLESSTVPKGSAKADFVHEMKLLGKKWKALPQTAKELYKHRCKEEFSQQRDALRAHGVQVRKPVGAQHTRQNQPSQPPQLSQPSQPPDTTDGHVKGSDALWAFGNVKVQAGQAPLGEGSYGNVLQGMMPNGRLCAVKIFKCKKRLLSLEQEVLLLNLIKEKMAEQERCLFPALWAVDSKNNPFPYMVLEHGGTSLLQVLRSDGALNNQSLSLQSMQLQAAVQALHTIRVLHLDIKPGNILWIKETSQMKLTDFGMSEVLGVAACDLRFDEYVSAPYRPPELWNASVSELCKHLRPSVDIWACGCVLFESFAGDLLMKPIPPAHSCRDTVQVWCRSWGQLQAARGPKLVGCAQRLQTRFLRAGPLRHALLHMLNPDPASRKWKS